MKILLTFILLPFVVLSQRLEVKSPLRFLALGDSYTIGQSVGINERWPVQLKDSLIARGIVADTLGIIATTGWRTDNLLNAITNQNLTKKNFNLVSLLIGVNNQFQGCPFSQQQTEFIQLLDSAILYAGGDPKKVFVVSIPDYAYTPYGQQTSNPSQISAQLDQYNAYNKHIADSFDVRYFDITPISRQGLANPNYVAGDGLHPSGVQYAQWVKLMLGEIDVLFTGINSLKSIERFGLNIFPTPATDLITIEIDEKLISGSTLIIYDFMGREVRNLKFNSSSIILSVSDLPNGVYSVNLNSNNKVGLKKLIVSH